MSTRAILGDRKSTGENALPHGEMEGQKTQVPIDSKLRFQDTQTGSPLLQVAVTGATPPAGYKSYTEYWSRLSPLKTSAITMLSFGFSTRQGTQEHGKVLKDWLTGGSVLATDQQAQATDWIQGVHQPTSPKSALYSAVDPDFGGAIRLGLLLELGSDDQLLNVIWYKVKQPTNGLIFQQSPLELSFTQVVDDKGPTIDPYKIDDRLTWYFYRGVMRPV